MIDETALLAAVFNSKEAFDHAQNTGIELADLGDAAQCVYSAVAEQYGRDPDLRKADYATLRSQIVRRYGEGAMANSVLDFVSSFPEDTSSVNVVEEYRLLRVARTATELATALATGQNGSAVDELLEKYKALKDGESEGKQEKYRLTLDDFKSESGQRLGLMPKTLNNYIGGGVLRGHNITVYGRPDSGKSMFAINQAAYACAEGYKVLYIANEEPSQDITKRLLARMARIKIEKLHDPACLQRAFKHVSEAYQNWYLLHKAGVTVKDIRRHAARVNPDFIVVDQLKNVAVADDNRALQLDKLARHVRELGIEFNAVTISVTQAGESAQDHLNLRMSDVEWSNTGIPGAADLMIGIGVDDEWQTQGKRMLSLPKNKINGRHGSFPVWVAPEYTAFLSKRLT